MTCSFFERFFTNVIWARKAFKNCKTLRTDTLHFFVVTCNAKMAAEGTFEPCEKGTNDPAVQRSLSIWSNVSTLNTLTFKISQCENDSLLRPE